MMSCDRKRKADPKERPGPTKTKRINPKNEASTQSYYSTLRVPKRISSRNRTAAKAMIDPAKISISSGGRNDGRIGIAVRAKIDAMKSSISSAGRNGWRNGIACRAKINPRAMMTPGIGHNLVKKAVNSVLMAIISRPQSNPIQRNRRQNFKPTRSRFHPDFTSAPPSSTVVAKSGKEDLVWEAVSWLMRARMSNATTSNFKTTPIRTPVRTLGSGCLLTTQSVIISS